MFPTFESGTIVPITQADTFIHGDIVVFKYQGKQLVKRIIGLPGDTIQMIDGVLFRNGKPILETYAILDHSNVDFLIVPEGHLFVLGDNRPHSRDSRQIGCISIDTYIGTIVLTK